MNKICLFWSGGDGWTAKPSIKMNRLYLPFEDMPVDFSNAGNETLIRREISESREMSSKRFSEFVYQSIDLLKNGIEIGDWVIISGRFGTLYHIGEVMGDYTYEFDEDYGLHHSRKMHWFAKNIPSLGFPISITNTLSKRPTDGPFLLDSRQTDDFHSIFRYRAF